MLTCMFHGTPYDGYCPTCQASDRRHRRFRLAREVARFVLFVACGASGILACIRRDWSQAAMFYVTCALVKP